MKININKVIYIILGSIAIGLSSVLCALLLYTNYMFLQYISLFGTYFLGIYFVKTKNKYKLSK